MTALVWVGVVLFGGLGAVGRLLVDRAVTARMGGAFPYGTLVVNVSGSVLLGLVTGLALPHDAALLAGTAVIGSYTTFSTWVFDAQRLTEQRRGRAAVVDIVVSVVLGVAAAVLGRAIAGLL